MPLIEKNLIYLNKTNLKTLSQVKKPLPLGLFWSVENEMHKGENKKQIKISDIGGNYVYYETENRDCFGHGNGDDISDDYFLAQFLRIFACFCKEGGRRMGDGEESD